MFQAKFRQFHGVVEDPVIQIFRDSGQDAVIFLARQMKSKDPAIRAKAAGALRYMGRPFTASDIGLAALCEALNQPDSHVREIAEGALGDAGRKPRRQCPHLLNAFQQALT